MGEDMTHSRYVISPEIHNYLLCLEACQIANWEKEEAEENGIEYKKSNSIVLTPQNSMLCVHMKIHTDAWIIILSIYTRFQCDMRVTHNFSFHQQWM